MSDQPPDDPAALARACADAMWAEDRASAGLGMSLDAVGPGTATLSMEIGPAMVNGHGMCHGGYIFALADSAFAFACNTYGDRTVAQQASILFVRPGRLGERLVAHATERTRAGRTGLYDIGVTGDDGSVVAEFRGQSRSTGRPFFAPE